jgi:hypothetical protein
MLALNAVPVSVCVVPGKAIVCAVFGVTVPPVEIVAVSVALAVVADVVIVQV